MWSTAIRWWFENYKFLFGNGMARKQSDGQRILLIWASGCSLEEKESESTSQGLGRFCGDHQRGRSHRDCHQGMVEEDKRQGTIVWFTSRAMRQLNTGPPTGIWQGRHFWRQEFDSLQDHQKAYWVRGLRGPDVHLPNTLPQKEFI